MKYWRYGVCFPGSGLHWEDGAGDLGGDPGDPAAGGDPIGDPNQDGTVPISVVQAIRYENKGLKDAIEDLKGQALMLGAALRERNGGNNQLAPASGSGSMDGKEDDDIVTVGEVKAAMSRIQANTAESVATQRLLGQPDFEKVIKNHWPNVLKADPSLAQDFAGLSQYQQAAMAYRLGKTDPAYLKEKNVTAPGVETKPKNPNAPRSPQSVGAKVPSGEQSYDDMSPQEFAKFRANARRKGARA